MSDDEPGKAPPKRRWRNREILMPSGERQLAERVRKKNVAKESSRLWIERQLNDPYVQRAQAEGWRARSAYKLIELDDKFHFLKRGARVVDLGAAPGSWAQVVQKRGAATIVGIDLLPVDRLPGVTFLEMDFLAPEASPALMKALGGAPDLVLSDMAANTTGHARTDQIR